MGNSLTQKLELFLNDNLDPTCTVTAHELNTLWIQSNHRFLSNCIFERNISWQSGVISKSNTKVFLGANSYMNDGGYIREFVFVGRYCSIGRRVTIGAGIHQTSGLSTSPYLSSVGRYTEIQRKAAGLPPISYKSKYTILENDVWVGDGAIIATGVRVSTGAVIGANSVVTRDVGPYMVVAGAPAKPLRCRFSQEVVERLLHSSYWDYPTASLQSLPCGNIFEFLEAFESQSLIPENFETYKLS